MRITSRLSARRLLLGASRIGITAFIALAACKTNAGNAKTLAEQPEMSSDDPRDGIVAVFSGHTGSIEEEQYLLRAALATTGPSVEPWTYQARRLFEQAQISGKLEVRRPRLISFTCFRAGCAAVLGFSDFAHFELAASILTDGEALRGWTGPRISTLPMKRAREQVAVWILVRPDNA